MEFKIPKNSKIATTFERVKFVLHIIYGVSFVQQTSRWQLPSNKNACLNIYVAQIWGNPLPSLVVQMVKNLPAVWEIWVRSLGWRKPWRRIWQIAPLFLPGKFHGQGILTGYSPWGLRELDMTEQGNTIRKLWSLLCVLQLTFFMHFISVTFNLVIS